MPLKYELEAVVLDFELCFYFNVYKRSVLFLKEVGTKGRLDRVSSIPSCSRRSGFKSEPAYELYEPVFLCFSQRLQTDTRVSYTDSSLSWFDTPVGLDLLRDVPGSHPFGHLTR
jgi:hypothetical protein